jgi:hypothetical protein
MKGTAMDPWKIAEKAIKEMPPYLGDDELTAQRLYEKNKDKLSGIEDARTILKELVEAGQLRVEERRSGKSGSRIKVYLPAEKGK